MAVEDELVEVRWLLGGEPAQAQIIEDEQVGVGEGPKGMFQGVVDSGLGHGFEEVVGVDETHGVAGPT